MSAKSDTNSNVLPGAIFPAQRAINGTRNAAFVERELERAQRPVAVEELRILPAGGDGAVVAAEEDTE
ncbi:MAG: hypothetical protein M3463_03755 [Verrucomicrobiota bacterium]|nr:hypothetical protein [Verrucomicrobiota bacterium]